MDEGLQVKTVDDCLLLDDVAIQYTTSLHHWQYSLLSCFLSDALRWYFCAFSLNASVLTQLATEAQLNRVCNYIGKVDVLDNNTAVVETIDDAEEAKTVNNKEIQANTNNSNNNKFVAAVNNFNNINISGAADDN
jgi:hypothetical protein